MVARHGAGMPNDGTGNAHCGLRDGAALLDIRHSVIRHCPMSIYRRVALYYRPFWAPTAVATLFTLASTAFNLLRVWPFAYIVEHFLRSGPNGPGAAVILGHDFSSVPAPTLILLLCAAMVVFHL